MSRAAIALGAFIRALRPKQWAKNLFVLAPLVFARDILDGGQATRAAGATFLFCLISGAVYLLNDLCDVEADRAHPVKRHRPIAAGDLSVPAAMVGYTFLLLLCLVGGWFWLGSGFAIAGGTYLVLNSAYSFRLKHFAYLDVLIIATGFLLRVIAGAMAIDVPVSPWVLVCTFLLALYLGFGKRLHELCSLGPGSPGRRKSLDGYTQRHLEMWMRALAVLTSVAYLAYTFAPQTVEKFDTWWLPATVPSILYGLLRFHTLVLQSADAESPTDRMIRDKPFLANLAVWGILVLGILYMA